MKLNSEFLKVEILKDLKLEILKNWNLGFWKLRLEILNMKSKVWNFLQLGNLETEDLNLKIGHWEYGIESLGMKI